MTDHGIYTLTVDDIPMPDVNCLKNMSDLENYGIHPIFIDYMYKCDIQERIAMIEYLVSQNDEYRAHKHIYQALKNPKHKLISSRII